MGYGEFFRGLLHNPRAVSAPTPSSPALAAAMAAKVDRLRPGLVLELGPGTGVVTCHSSPSDDHGLAGIATGRTICDQTRFARKTSMNEPRQNAEIDTQTLSHCRCGA